MSANTMTTKFTQQYIVFDGDISNPFPNWTVYDGSLDIGCAGEQNGSVSSYRISYLKFTTPNFNGISKNIRIKFYVHDISANTHEMKSVPLRFAVCKSDKNKDMYRNTISSVSEETQLVSGVWEVKYLKTADNFEGYAEEFTIDCSTLKPNTTYYFFLWGSDTPQYQYWYNRYLETHYAYLSEHVITITYYENVAHIDTSSEFKVCECYIDTGDSWKPIVPYIDTGTDWKISI